MKPVDFVYHRATSVEDALEHLAAGGDGTKLLGGGQSLGPMLNLRLTRPAALVDISAVEALRGIESTRESVIAGAAATHAEIEDRAASDPIEHAMREVAAGIAYRAVRNRGTIGGSIVHADPSADWASFLLCADARVRIRGVTGERAVRMQEFTHAAYTTEVAGDEIVTRIEVPRTSARARFGFYKLCRKTGELAEAMGAVLVDPRAALLPRRRRRRRLEAGAAAGGDAIARRHRRPTRARSASRRDRRLHRRARSGEAAHGRGRGAPRRRPGAGGAVTGAHGSDAHDHRDRNRGPGYRPNADVPAAGE